MTDKEDKEELLRLKLQEAISKAPPSPQVLDEIERIVDKASAYNALQTELKFKKYIGNLDRRVDKHDSLFRFVWGALSLSVVIAGIVLSYIKNP